MHVCMHVCIQAWNSNGSVLAVGGVANNNGRADAKNESHMQFYDAFGRHLRTLKVPAPGSRCVSVCV